MKFLKEKKKGKKLKKQLHLFSFSYYIVISGLIIFTQTKNTRNKNTKLNTIAALN